MCQNRKHLGTDHSALRQVFLASLLTFLALRANDADAQRGGREILNFERPDKEGNRLLLPPGPFTDGYQYDLSEMKGKVVVLLYFEPTAADAIVQTQLHLEQMALFAGRPVKVLCIARGDRNGVANAFRQFKGTLPPTNFDPSVALSSIWFINGRSHSFSVFDPEGNVCVWSAMEAFEDTVTKACEKATWKYKDDNYNKALIPAIDQLEWNHYSEGLKLLRPLRKDSRKPVAESAEKLYGVIKAEGDKWKADADNAVSDNPARAYDLYARLVAAFPGEDLGKAAADSIKALKAKKAVTDELAAREMLAQLSALPFDRRRTPATARDLLAALIAKYPGTPSADRAKLLRTAIPLSGF